MQDLHIDDRDELNLDVSQLTESELEVLARLVLRKLRIWMQQESDRAGRS